MRSRLLLLLCLGRLLPVAAQAWPVRIGSKQFTESVILG
jgi:glycine betaine/choline ABC-type transport system substrate-binding protein